MHLITRSPSGAGKSSLLNILACRTVSTRSKSIVVTGSVRLNGKQIDPNKFREQVAYVMQQDVMCVNRYLLIWHHDVRLSGLSYYCNKVPVLVTYIHDDSRSVVCFFIVCRANGGWLLARPSLTCRYAYQTPREAFRFSAKLRLPEDRTPEERADLVEWMIRVMGLEACADTRIGNIKVRGSVSARARPPARRARARASVRPSVRCGARTMDRSDGFGCSGLLLLLLLSSRELCAAAAGVAVFVMPVLLLLLLLLGRRRLLFVIWTLVMRVCVRTNRRPSCSGARHLRR